VWLSEPVVAVFYWRYSYMTPGHAELELLRVKDIYD